MSKQYGLIIPNKDRGHKIGQVSAVRPSVFNDDSDSDTPSTKPTGLTRSVKKQDVLNQKKAIEEDPTVFQYDEIYDKMEQAQKESKLSRKDLEKKPKYISRLLAAAEKRKRENERRIERQVQKEREEEGEEFKDKESFVTSAYKKKLEEMRELEEQEKREEYLETIGDVRKQGNLDGFYRHLYDQKVNYEDKIKEENAEVKKEPESDVNSDNDEKNTETRKSASPERRRSSEGRTPKRRRSSDDNSEAEGTIKRKKDIKSRKYRSRRDSDDEDKSDAENEVKKEHLPSNLDADSDFSIDSSDSDEENATENGKQKKKENGEQVSKDTNVKEENGEKSTEIVEEKKEEKVEEKKVEVKPKKPEIDIWKKRTVGEKFDEALKRYFERKALREAGM